MNVHRGIWIVGLLILLLGYGCSDRKEQGPVGPVSERSSYEEDVAPLLKQRCVSCHSGETPSGNYDLSTYLDLLGGGSDAEPNAVPGDPYSRLVTRSGEDTHPYILPEQDMKTLWTWVVQDSMALAETVVHEHGWMDENSQEFLGVFLREHGFDLAACRSCHGEDYEGGISGESCSVCHKEGPEACNTCHGSLETSAPPKDVEGHTETTFRGVGSHQAHVLGGEVGTPLGCSACHVNPESFDAPGHIDGARPAEITWGELARAGGADPTWDGTTCSNVYCHGEFAPVWTKVGEGQAACGTCHGLPPGGTHPASDICNLCHPGVVDENRVIIDRDRHIDGEVDYDQAALESCNTCHGSAENNAPPQDLAGHTETTHQGVGAHQVHVMGGEIGTPLDCSACHINPDAFDAPGHFDDTPGAEIVWGALARANDADPVWDGTTCSNVYCHGESAPVWTEVGSGQAACGTCHGLPPGGTHPASNACNLCHGRVVDEDLMIIDRDLHINGEPDTF